MGIYITCIHSEGHLLSKFYKTISYSSKVWQIYMPYSNKDLAAIFIKYVISRTGINFIHNNSSMENDMGKHYINTKLFWINDKFTNIESTWMVMMLKYISFHVNFFFFRPCILVFDSLAGQNRSRIVSILKEWVLSI